MGLRAAVTCQVNETVSPELLKHLRIHAHAVCLHTHIHIHCTPDESAQKYRIESIHPTSLAFECHVSLPYAYAVFSVCFCFSFEFEFGRNIITWIYGFAQQLHFNADTQ